MLSRLRSFARRVAARIRAIRARRARAIRASRRRVALVLAGLVAIAITGWATLRLAPLPDRLHVAHSTLVEFADGSPAHVFLAPDGRYRVATTPEDLASGAVDPDFARALLRFEDKRFGWHPGVDPLAIARAIALNARHGEVVSGGSTLTMQLVRILTPRPRTLRSKLVEAVEALALEAQLSKAEILSAYLTFAPYGRNIEGVQAASLAYFGHGAADLAPEEIATLLAVPQSPTRRHPSAENAARLREARDAVAERLVNEGALGPGDAATRAALLARVRAAAPPAAIRPLPRDIPHAATWLASSAPARGRIESTLGRDAQRIAEEAVRRARAEAESHGIHGVSVVVLDHGSGAIRALVGGFDFWDARAGSQIAAFAVPRSPGSALKPLLYALAIDEGRVLPKQLVADVPVQHGSYAPENYGGAHAGLVRLDEALAWSLNIPFVDLLAQVGVEPFLSTLRQAGITGPSAQPGRYGLSAAVGGIEVTPLELASAYATLAMGGARVPLRALRSPDGDGLSSATDRAFSPGAAWLTHQALSRRDRPDLPMRRLVAAPPARIAWKTGTSYGRRDAWAAGSGPRMTVVVWLGNLDNAPSVDLVGAETAAPILFDILEALERGAPATRSPMPRDLRPVVTCAYSGCVPGPGCRERSTDLALASRVPTKPCPFHVVMDVDLDTGLALNPTCRANRRWESRAFVTWPPAVRRWLTGQHLRLPEPPDLDASCEVAAARAPRIVMPPNGQTLLLVPGLSPQAQQVPLEATGTGRRIAWFVNGEYLATTAASERAWWTPSPGEHRIVATDETGATARRTLTVRLGA